MAAGAAYNATDLLADPHLSTCGFWQTLDRPFVASCTMLSAPFREGVGPLEIRRVSPTLGQDNDAVFSAQPGWTAKHLIALREPGLSVRTRGRSCRSGVQGPLPRALPEPIGLGAVL